ncbi:SGNH/GDSL hydrolase family protein [Cohnella endophytica]|uniref:SGNH/GDSL hydrolase family protein n=1 Tax=Cohnella endophytica TaxID=2419778 RepID=A0A494YE24_9BACL|nr:SGNH/GDSL hydrolase family protein [Cohnella endophytica]RKP58285.1 SGNH/GDSL hydrolase family protein [Cohnella endophytica]
MKVSYSGLAIVPTKPASMNLIIEPGRIHAGDQVIELDAASSICIREAGQRQYNNQLYRIVGEGTASPSGWNGENLRGTAGMPYQRMVPGSLQVYSKDREKRYVPEVDYTQDSYWGSIRRHPQGEIGVGQELSIDYTVWLCRYDAIVLLENGTIQVVEGDSEAPESRELLLPEPPAVKTGFVLAHVFTGWGQSCIYGGGCLIAANSSTSSRSTKTLPVLAGRYEDMVERTYVVEVTAEEGDSQGQYQVRIGATGEDYGTNDIITMDTLRWTEPKRLPHDRKLPLLLQSAYRYPVSWGLELDFSQWGSDANLDLSGEYTVTAYPEMIFDRRPALNGIDPLDIIPLEQRSHLDGFREKIASGTPVRIAFFGASNANSGLWPGQVVRELRQAYPQTAISTSVLAYGGEEMRHGMHRFHREVLPVQPDLIVMEYFINDVCYGNPEETEQAARFILQSIQNAGIPCIVLTNNGANPLFSRNGSSSSFQKYHELYRGLASEYQMAFIGAYAYFSNLHLYGKYFLTELKGNMVNHPYGIIDRNWGVFDRVLSNAILKILGTSGGNDGQ